MCQCSLSILEFTDIKHNNKVSSHIPSLCSDTIYHSLQAYTVWCKYIPRPRAVEQEQGSVTQMSQAVMFIGLLISSILQLITSSFIARENQYSKKKPETCRLQNIMIPPHNVFHKSLTLARSFASKISCDEETFTWRSWDCFFFLFSPSV